MHFTNSAHKQLRLYRKGLKCQYCGAKVIVVLYHNVTICTVSFDSVAAQKSQLKKKSVKFEIKSQIALQAVQSCSQAVQYALRSRSKNLSFVTSSKDRYFWVGRLIFLGKGGITLEVQQEGKKVKLLAFEKSLFSGGVGEGRVTFEIIRCRNVSIEVSSLCQQSKKSLMILIL